MAGFVAGCGANTKKLNERVTLWRKDKIPYGTWYAYEQVQHIFPDATIMLNKKSPADRYDNDALVTAPVDETEPAKNTYLIIAGQVRPSDRETGALLQLAQEGNHVFISSMWIGQNLLDTLDLNTAYGAGFLNRSDSLTVEVFDPVTEIPDSFTYPGRAMDNYFNTMDSSVTSILGHDHEGRANYVKIAYNSGGAIYLHLAPIALTNFFLLHKNNKVYYDLVLSQLPSKAPLVYWDEYFRYHTNGEGGSERNGFSALGWLKKQPGLAAAWWLCLLLLLIIYLVESKRKQRVIPPRMPLRNASVEFVKTIGALYFQRRDNNNLANKMVAHFQDHVRNRYNIRASQMDDDFVKRLAWKSGYDEAALHNLVYQLNMAVDDPGTTDHSLVAMHQKLEDFYKHV